MPTTEEQAAAMAAAANSGETDTPVSTNTPINEPDPAAAPAAAATDSDDEDWYNDPEKVRAEVKKARDEAAATRVKGKAFHDAFAGYNDYQREWMLSIVGGLAGTAEQQAAAIAELRTVIGDVSTDDDSSSLPSNDDKPTQEEEKVAEGLTEADVQRLIEAKRAEDQRQREVDAMVADITKVREAEGFQENTVEWETVLTIARKNTDESKSMAQVMTEAVATFRKSQQSAIDAFVEEQRRKGVRFPTQSRMNAGPPATDAGEDDWKGDPAKTKAKALELLRAARNPGSSS